MTAKPLATTDEREAREGGVGTRVNRDVLAEALCNLLVDNNKKTQQELSYNRTAPLATTDERETRGGGVGTSVNGDALAEALCNNVLVDNNKKTQQELSYDRTANVNADVGVFWLGQVSAAATALTGTPVPRELSDSKGVTKISGRAIAAGRSTSLSIRRDDSFYPDIPLAKSDLQCRSKLAILSRLMITLVLACTSLLASGEFTSTGTDHRLTSEGLNGSFSSALSPDAVKATVGKPFSPRLIAQPSSGMSGEPLRLGLTIHGASEQAVVYLTDLVRGMELTTGDQVDSQSWEVPAAELSRAWIAPPDGFVGAINLIAELRLPDGTTADRQELQFEWLVPMSQAPAIRPVQDAAVPILLRQPVQAEGDPETTAIDPRPVDRNGTAAVPSSSLAAGQIHLAQAASSPTLHQLNRAESGKAPSILAEPIQLKTNQDQIETSDSSLPALQRQLDSQDAAVPPVSPATNSSLPHNQLESQDVAPSVSAVTNSSPPPVQRQLNSEEIIVLLKRGKDLIAAGDLAAARIVLRKAAEANDAEAALATSCDLRSSRSARTQSVWLYARCRHGTRLVRKGDRAWFASSVTAARNADERDGTTLKTATSTSARDCADVP